MEDMQELMEEHQEDLVCMVDMMGIRTEEM